MLRQWRQVTLRRPQVKDSRLFQSVHITDHCGQAAVVSVTWWKGTLELTNPFSGDQSSQLFGLDRVSEIRTHPFLMVIIFEIELPASQSTTEIIQFASLRVDFYTGKNSAYSSLTAFDEEQEELLERLAGLPCLERFYVPEYWYRCELHCAESELDRLRRLNRVQDIYFSPTSIDELKDADVEWMLEH